MFTPRWHSALAWPLCPALQYTASLDAARSLVTVDTAQLHRCALPALQYTASLDAAHSLVTVDTICPATAKHIAKHTAQAQHMASDSGETEVMQGRRK
jgi:hypothetical protein